MTGALYRAIENRYNSLAALVKNGGKLYRGYGGKRLSTDTPSTVVDFDDVPEPEDTFGFDCEVVQVTFTMFTKREIQFQCDEAFDALLQMFDDAEWETADLKIGVHRRIRWDGPKIVDEGDASYRTVVQYEMHAQRVNNHPPVRGQ